MPSRNEVSQLLESTFKVEEAKHDKPNAHKDADINIATTAERSLGFIPVEDVAAVINRGNADREHPKFSPLAKAPDKKLKGTRKGKRSLLRGIPERMKDIVTIVDRKNKGNPDPQFNGTRWIERAPSKKYQS